jgi:hypothetical protein
VTLAVGRPRFLEMAVDMVLSLREHTDLPVALVTDETLAPSVRTTYRAVFDDVTFLASRFLQGRGRKYGVAEASPFEEAMFVDADSIVFGRLDHLFSALATSPLAMVGSQLGPEHDENHHGFSSRWLMRRFGLDRYMKTNSGLFCFRRSDALEIMDECLDCFLNEARPALRWRLLLGKWLGDEIAFGIVGGRRNLGMLPVPAPMYWPTEVEAFDPSAPTKPVLHFIWPPPPEAVDALVAGMAERRARAGVPGSGEAHWRDEVRSLNEMAKRRRLAERLGLY